MVMVMLIFCPHHHQKRSGSQLYKQTPDQPQSGRCVMLNNPQTFFDNPKHFNNPHTFFNKQKRKTGHSKYHDLAPRLRQRYRPKGPALWCFPFCCQGGVSTKACPFAAPPGVVFCVFCLCFVRLTRSVTCRLDNNSPSLRATVNTNMSEAANK